MKESMVTRTIQTTRATVLCLDVDTAEPSNKTYILPRTYKKDADIIKAIKKIDANSDVCVPVHVVDVVVEEARYGMTESEFLSNARLITNNTKED